MHTVIDLSHPLTDLMPVYPGDEPPRLQKVNDLDKDGFNNYRLTIGMHSGTHIDGPMHLTTSGKFLNEIPADRFIGKGCLLNALGKTVIQRTTEFESLVETGSIAVLYTGHSRLFGRKEYYASYPTVSAELARLFVERQIKMLCLDTPSPDRHPFAIHTLLLENDVLIAENCTNIDKLLSRNTFDVFALPLSLNADSSPARIIARILE